MLITDVPPTRKRRRDQSIMLTSPLLAPTTDSRAERLLRLLRGAFFLGGFSGTSYERFVTLFFVRRGLSAEQIGILEAIKPVIQALGTQQLSILADTTHKRKLVSLSAQAMSCSLLMLLLIPELGCYGCWLTIGLVVCAVAAFCQPATSVLDAYTLDTLDEVGRPRDYGKYRLALAISWGVGASVQGLVADGISIDACFPIYAVFTLLQLGLLSYILPGQTRSEATLAAAEHQSAPSVWLFWRATCTPRNAFFICEIALFGCGIAFVEKFLFVYATEELRAPARLCGYSVGMTVILELPLFYWAEPLLRWCGYDLLMVLSLVAYTMRVYCFTLLTPQTVWLLLPIELLHGVSFGLAWTVAIDFWRAVTPTEWLMTSMWLLNIAKECVGTGTGALLGGWAMQHASFMGIPGGRGLYLFASLGGATLAMTHAALAIGLRCSRSGHRGLLYVCTT